MTIKSVYIEQMSVKEFEFQDKKTGTQKKGYNVGIKVDDTWINGAVFNKEDIGFFEEGKTVNVEIFEQEYNGKKYKKFKAPNRQSILESRVLALEEENKALKERVDRMAEFLNTLNKNE